MIGMAKTKDPAGYSVKKYLPTSTYQTTDLPTCLIYKSDLSP